VAAGLFHSDGHTDRHDEANSRFSKFFERDWGRNKTKAGGSDEQHASMMLKMWFS
jgi:hypothetical protein